MLIWNFQQAIWPKAYQKSEWLTWKPVRYLTFNRLPAVHSHWIPDPGFKFLQTIPQGTYHCENHTLKTLSYISFSNLNIFSPQIIWIWETIHAWIFSQISEGWCPFANAAARYVVGARCHLNKRGWIQCSTFLGFIFLGGGGLLSFQKVDTVFCWNLHVCLLLWFSLWFGLVNVTLT